MYEYKFIRIEITKWGFESKPKNEYHEIVNENAREGWRLHQIFSPNIRGYGTAAFIELIFEREIM